MTYWHAYLALVPDTAVDGQGERGAALAFTTIGPFPDEQHPDTYKGRVLGHDLIYSHVATWDHEPSEEEKEAVKPEQYQAEKESK